MNRQDDFLRFRKQYPVFCYDDFHIEQGADEIALSFDFSVEGLGRFRPRVCIQTAGLRLVNPADSPLARRLVFSLGMVEVVSYLKAACPGRLLVRCGTLDAWQKAFWTKLYYHGLGEFFYTNGIEVSQEEFLDICCEDTGDSVPAGEFCSAGKHLIPVGGGKDSAVTIDLLRDFYEENLFFTVNDQPARTQTVLAAGYGEERIIKTYRTIDPALLELNRRGFLNGHTPFSAVVAFLSLYCAYLVGAQDVVLSNESSANEPSVAGSDVNHQYSKSFAFEADFQAYARKYLAGIRYFSLLRPFSEFHIAKRFAALPQYHGVFRSCNAGSKRNVWCGACGKCLFVFAILSPFLSQEELVGIFGENLLDKASLLEEFRGLAGLVPQKPFECVGTVDELRYALALTVRGYRARGHALPALLAYFVQQVDVDAVLGGDYDFLRYNTENSIPDKFLGVTKEMYAFVTRD